MPFVPSVISNQTKVLVIQPGSSKDTHINVPLYL